MGKPYRRRKHLIKPRIQLLSALTFLSTAGVYVLLQAILLQGTLRRITEQYPEAAEAVLPPLLTGMRTNLMLTFAVLVPLTLSIGIMLTFRIVGPIYRFECYLRQIMAGEDPGPCRIRKADELHDFCKLLNEAVEPLRAANAARLARVQAEPAAAGTAAAASEAAQAGPLPSGTASDAPAETTETVEAAEA